MMNNVMTKLNDHALDQTNGGLIVYDKYTGKYWVVSDDGGLFHPDYSYDQQSAIELARKYGFSTRMYYKEEFMNEFGSGRISY